MGSLKHDLERFMFRGGEFPEAHFAGGDHIIHEGHTGESAYIIVSGSCEVYRMIEGTRVSIRTMGPGELFGETAILSPGPRVANVVALEDTTLYVVTADVLEKELDRLKPWLASLIRTLGDRFRELEQQRTGGDLRLSERNPREAR
jgi:serine/threonine-protein kinase